MNQKVVQKTSSECLWTLGITHWRQDQSTRLMDYNCFNVLFDHDYSKLYTNDQYIRANEWQWIHDYFACYAINDFISLKSKNISVTFLNIFIFRPNDSFTFKAREKKKKKNFCATFYEMKIMKYLQKINNSTVTDNIKHFNESNLVQIFIILSTIASFSAITHSWRDLWIIFCRPRSLSLWN